MATIRSPLGAIGVILVALEVVFGGIVLALDEAPVLRAVMAVAMVAVFAAVALVVLWMVVYLTLKNPGFLFNPAEVAKLSESVQRGIYAIPVEDIVISGETFDLTETGGDLHIIGEPVDLTETVEDLRIIGEAIDFADADNTPDAADSSADSR